ncbi:hypothetical protein [Miltoncostaea oceani]|uniref:hypothetical protein n=1 Tax=Miltoncostaea oceani TaxID=2843216 RepID=UPI001C3D52CE|nr:hypothetical protein [Miltoncostaea oceani]
MSLTPDSDEPPLARWEQMEAMRALGRLATERTLSDPDRAWRSLGRLTGAQRDWILSQLDEGDRRTEMPPGA